MIFNSISFFLQNFEIFEIKIKIYVFQLHYHVVLILVCLGCKLKKEYSNCNIFFGITHHTIHCYVIVYFVREYIQKATKNAIIVICYSISRLHLETLHSKIIKTNHFKIFTCAQQILRNFEKF